jgi:hypothetical protein
MGTWSKYRNKHKKILYKFDGEPVRAELVPNSIKEALQGIDEVEDKGTTSHPSYDPKNRLKPSKPAGKTNKTTTAPPAAPAEDEDDTPPAPNVSQQLAEQNAAKERGDKPGCLFSQPGEQHDEATRRRMVNGIIVNMCQVHYDMNNIGRIAQRMREIKEKKFAAPVGFKA